MTETISTNPLLAELRQTISKTINVAFPTKGQFYHEGVVREGTDYASITVHPLSIGAEMILRDTILMAAGRAIPKMIATLVPEVLDPEELSDIDVEVILLAIRIASYGADITIDHKCANPALIEQPVPASTVPGMESAIKPAPKLVCEVVNPLQISLIDHIQRFVEITDWSPYRIEFQIDANSKQIVHLRRMPYRSVLTGIRHGLAAEQDMEQFKDKTFDQLVMSDDSLRAYEKMTELVSTTNLGTLLEAIISVEMVRGEKSEMFYTNEKPEMIREWLWSIPADWVRELNERVNSLARELAEKNTIKYDCPQCKFKNEFQMQLDVNKLFFSRSPASAPTGLVSETSTAPTKSRPRRPSRTSSR